MHLLFLLLVCFASHHSKSPTTFRACAGRACAVRALSSTECTVRGLEASTVSYRIRYLYGRADDVRRKARPMSLRARTTDPPRTRHIRRTLQGVRLAMRCPDMQAGTA